MNVGQQENGTGGVWCQLLREDLQYKKPHLLVDAVGVQYHVAAVSHLGGVSTKGEGHGERPAPPHKEVLGFSAFAALLWMTLTFH